MTPWRRWLSALSVPAIVLSGCSDDGSPGSIVDAPPAADSRPPLEGGVLEDLAESLVPGQWGELATEGARVALKGNGGDIFEYSNRGAWDPNGRRAYFCGASHHGSFFNDCLQYDEATNTWSSIGVPPGFCMDNCPADGTVANIVHGYDHNTFDPTRGHFYLRTHRTLHKYDPSTSTWSTAPELPFASGQGTVCEAITGILEYFVDIDRIVYLNARCNGDAFYYDPGADSWSVPVTPVNAIGDGEIHTEGTYSKLGHLYGGCGNGSSEVWRLNDQLEWEELDDAPASCLITYSLMVADPVTGRPLLFAMGGNIHELDPQNLSWSDTGVSSNIGELGSGIVIPLSNHGVVMLVKTVLTQTEVEVWLYKHAPP
jgi:hypothetical protein